MIHNGHLVIRLMFQIIDWTLFQLTGGNQMETAHNTERISSETQSKSIRGNSYFWSQTNK